MQQRLPRITLNRIFSSFALKTSVPREIKVMDRDSIKILVMTDPIRNIQKKVLYTPSNQMGSIKQVSANFFFFLQSHLPIFLFLLSTTSFRAEKILKRTKHQHVPF